MQPARTPSTIKGGLYWRQSPVNARKCVPAILTLDQGWLILTSATELAFKAPVPQVQAKFSAFGTMVLGVGGRKYPIVGRGGAISPQFTPAQIAELQQFGARPAPLGTGADLDFGFLVQSTAPWRDILRTHGAVVR